MSHCISVQPYGIFQSSWAKASAYCSQKNTPNMYAVYNYTEFWKVHNRLERYYLERMGF